MKLPGFVGPYGSSQSKNVEVSITENLFLESVEDGNGKNAYVMYRRPGYKELPVPFQAGVHVTSGCPAVQPIKGDAYTFTFTAAGGTAPYTWTKIAGSFPAGITLDDSTGIVSGTPSVTGTFPYTLRATDANGKFGDIHCAMTITRQSPFSPDITFGYASGEGSNINRFFILKAANDLRESKFVSGNFTSWTAPTIPAGSWKRLSWYGFTAGFFMTRGDGSSFIAVKDSVNPYHEVPWTAYPTSIAIKGRVASVDNPTADSGAPSALADSSPVVDIGCTKVIGGNVLNTNWIDSQSLPESGNWNAMMQDFGDPSNFSNPGVIVGNGARVIFSKSASWTPEDCPDGDWREVNTNNDGSDVFMAVGSNAKANQFMYTFDATTPGGWTVMAAPAGWNPTDPRIIFVNFGGTQPRSQGLFIAISGTDGQFR